MLHPVVISLQLVVYSEGWETVKSDTCAAVELSQNKEQERQAQETGHGGKEAGF